MAGEDVEVASACRIGRSARIATAAIKQSISLRTCHRCRGRLGTAQPRPRSRSSGSAPPRPSEQPAQSAEVRLTSAPRRAPPSGSGRRSLGRHPAPRHAVAHRATVSRRNSIHAEVSTRIIQPTPARRSSRSPSHPVPRIRRASSTQRGSRASVPQGEVHRLPLGRQVVATHDHRASLVIDVNVGARRPPVDRARRRQLRREHRAVGDVTATRKHRADEREEASTTSTQ